MEPPPSTAHHGIAAAIVFLSLLFAATTTFSQEAPSLGDQKTKFETKKKELLEPLQKLDQLYREQLGELEVKTQAAANLDQLVLVREEQKLFASGESKPAGDAFPELQRLQEIYAKAKADRESEYASALVPVLNFYLSKVEEIERSQTKAGEVGLALQAREESERIKTEYAAILNPDESSGGPELTSIATLGEKEGGRLKWSDFGPMFGKEFLKNSERLRDVVAFDYSRFGKFRWVAIRENGYAVASNGERIGKRGLSAIDVAMANSGGTLILYEDGTIDLELSGVTPPPQSTIDELRDIVDIAISKSYAAVLRNDGRLFLWGSPPAVPTEFQSGLRQIEIYSDRLYLLNEEGQIESFHPGGSNDASAHTKEGMPKIREFAIEINHILAVSEDGSLHTWGRAGPELKKHPEGLNGNVTALRVAPGISAVRKSNGSWVTWGRNEPQTNELKEKINGLTNVVDLKLFGGDQKGGAVFWIERDS